MKVFKSFLWLLVLVTTLVFAFSAIQLNLQAGRQLLFPAPFFLAEWAELVAASGIIAVGGAVLLAGLYWSEAEDAKATRTLGFELHIFTEEAPVEPHDQ